MADAPPLDAVLAYRDDYKDAVSQGPLTATTTLVPLHRPNLNHLSGQLQENLTNQARPAKVCTLISDDGTVFPPIAQLGETRRPSYRLLLTFNRLLTAPTVRLIVEWDNSVHAATNRDRHLQVLLDFHFQSPVSALSGFGVRKAIELNGEVQDEIHFNSFGATCEGFTLAFKDEAFLGAHGRQVLQHLRKIVTGPQRLRFRFPEPLDSNNSAMATVLPYIIGEGPHKLPSLNVPEYAAITPLVPQRDMQATLSSPASFPWMAHDVSDTYATVGEASVELYESSRISELEQLEMVRRWASLPHRGVLYRIGPVAFMAVVSSHVPPLGGPRGAKVKDLPDRMLTRMGWTVSGHDQEIAASASRCALPLRLPTAYDLLFVIDHLTPAICSAAIAPSEVSTGSVVEVTFQPTVPFPSPLLQHQLMTAVNLTHPDAVHWQRLVLNQSHDFKRVDLASEVLDGIAPLLKEDIDTAFDWMMNWRPWNREQIQALRSIRGALGGFTLITGPAGTGKSLVLAAICIYLYRLGFHLLVLAPANSNCSQFMKQLIQQAPDVLATRVFPPSTDFSPERIAKDHGKGNRSSQSATSAPGELFDFELVRAALTNEKYSQYSAYGLPAQVLEAARRQQYEFKQEIGGQRIDVWASLLEFIDLSEAGEFDWKDNAAVQAYQATYTACKAHYVALTRLVVTTTGNARIDDIVGNFASGRHGLPCKGMVVILDEACKDREVDTLSTLLHPNFRKKITGLVMLGDDKQLEPTNTSAKGSVCFNPFSGRLGLPLLTRLQRQGWPSTALVEQHRMSSTIAEFPSVNFYPPGMRNGPGTHGQLKDKFPGLHETLKAILKSLRKTRESPVLDLDNDAVIRTQYIEVRGTRDCSKHSPFVTEHIRLFFDKCFWPLRGYFQEQMKDNVLVIVAYKEAMHLWEEAAIHFARRFKLPQTQMPNILTIDSSQGSEGKVVFIDCSVQEYKPSSRLRDIGFVDDDKRMNVALTRAQEVRWIIGGSCSVQHRQLGVPFTPSYVRYREETSNLTIVKDKKLQLGDMSWLDNLRREEISLGSYAEDIARSE